MIAPHPPDEQFFDGLTIEGATLPPNWEYPLGTDLLGRDLLSRLLFGHRQVHKRSNRALPTSVPNPCSQEPRRIRGWNSE